MRNQNGYGGVTKLNGKRRRPYMAYKSEIISSGKTDLELEYNEAIKDPTPEKIGMLFLKLHPKDFKEELKKYIEPSVKQVKRPIGYYETRKEAMIALAKYNGNPYTLSEKFTFKDIWEAVYPTMNFDSKSDTRKYNYEHGFEMCSSIHSKDITKITIDELQNIIDVNKGKSNTTIMKPVQVIRAVYRYAKPRNIIQDDLSMYLKLPESSKVSERRPYSLEEIKRVWEISGNKTARIVLVLLYTGLRIGELLSVDQNMLKDGMVYVPGTKTDSAKRIVPINEKIIDLVHEVVPVKTQYYKFEKDYQTLMNILGMEHTIHETRHTFVTYSTDMDPIIRKYIIGHKTNDITDHYTHPQMMLDELKREIQKLKY